MLISCTSIKKSLHLVSTGKHVTGLVSFDRTMTNKRPGLVNKCLFTVFCSEDVVKIRSFLQQWMLQLLPGMSLGIESRATGFIFYSIKRNKCAVLTAHCTLALTYSNFRKDLRLPKNESLSNYLKKRDYKVPCGWSSSSSSPSSTLPAALYALHCVTPLILLLILLDLGSCSSLTPCSREPATSPECRLRMQMWDKSDKLGSRCLTAPSAFSVFVEKRQIIVVWNRFFP